MPNFRTPNFKVRKFRTPQDQGAKSLGQRKQFSHTPISRCETNSKVRNQFQGAKSIFKVRISLNPISHTTVEGAKIFALCEILSRHTCANFAHLKLIFALCETVCENFAHHCSRCENFAHYCSRCENFAHLISRCEFYCPKGAIFAHLIPRCENSSSRCENFAR